MGVRLLNDLREVIGLEDCMSSADIVSKLINIPESPWGDLKGKPLDERGLAARLRKYEIKPKTIRVGTKTPRGYERANLVDAFERYLSASPVKPATSKTATTSDSDASDPVAWK